MGQAWKARDTRLERVVAIKTTQVQFSAGRYTLLRSVQLGALSPPHLRGVLEDRVTGAAGSVMLHITAN